MADIADDKHRFGTDAHRAFLKADAQRLFDVFRASRRDGPGYHVLGYDGAPLPDSVQQLHTTTRMVHSYALGHIAGAPGAMEMVDHGMAYLWSHHRDPEHGGYVWAMDGDTIHDDRKLAYGHVFVLLAGASAKMVGHPDADRLIADATEVLMARFWEPDRGLFADEWNRDWTPFSTYRGMNANMHGIEALVTAFEATGERDYLDMAGQILSFFVGRMAPAHNWRLPEHYTDDWQIDHDFVTDNQMFRPEGTTPGHSFEVARLLLHWWDLAGRPDDDTPAQAWALTETALTGGWDAERGGIKYSLDLDGNVLIPTRYWWPVTEGIGVLASLLKLGADPVKEEWYARLWLAADAQFIDHDVGGWFPELDAAGQPARAQFNGKPDIYHALQADLFPLTPRLSRYAEDLAGVLA